MVFEAITKALTSVRETVADIRDEAVAAAQATEAAAKATTALDKSVVRVLNTAEEEASKLGAAAAKFMDGLKGLGNQPEIPQSAMSAPEMAARIKQERVGMFAGNEAGPATGRGATDWRDRFKPGYQMEPNTAPTASPSP